MKEKLVKLMENLNKGLVGREETIKVSLLTLLAGENTVLLGPPGTAKSEISRRISQVIDNGEYFEYLLTKFTTPEEIFGPLSIKELKLDNFKRKTEGYLPKANTAFLDEIFKANSSILNSLLTLINEKIFHNGNVKEEASLISLIGASNELPIGDSELKALYDRFLTRVVVDYINDEKIDELFNLPSEQFKVNKDMKIEINEIKQIREKFNNIVVPKNIRELIKNIRLEFNEEFKENNQENISDRKLVKVLKILKVSALTNGRETIDVSDVLLLKHCLWNNPNNIKKINRIIIKNIKSNTKLKDENILKNTDIDKNQGSNKKFKFKGMGTEDNPFLIEDEEDLIYINQEDYVDKGYYFKQVADIEIVSKSWHSIINFKGNYDGNNKEISNLNNSFFDIITDSSISNLNLKNVKINRVTENIGAVANYTKGNCTFDNCRVVGNVSSTSTVSDSNSCSGGLLGNVGGGSVEIRNCKIKGSVSSTSTSTSSSSYSGGLIGNIGGGNVEIRNCKIKGSVSSNSSKFSTSYSGGLLGNVGEGNVEISNCRIEGNVSSTSTSTSSSFSNSYSGGLLGNIGEGNVEIRNCKIEGSVSSNSTSDTFYPSTSTSNSGGLLGNIGEGNVEISNCRIEGSVFSASKASSTSTSTSNSGGVIGYIEKGESEIKNCSINIKGSAKILGGVIGYIKEGSAEKILLENNYILDTSTFNEKTINSSDSSSINGESLDQSKFSEKFYKRLGWDLTNIWKWENNNIVLRDFLETEENIKDIESIVVVEKDRLAQLLKNNIWL